MKVVTVIPARYKSTRFPGKPLLDIAGQSMIYRVYQKCMKVVSEDTLFVATDSDLIYEHCKSHHMNVVMTSSDCLTGTDRIAEFSKIVEADYYINVQGDEPVIDPNDILKIKDAIEHHKGKVLNGYSQIKTEDQFRSLSIPKVVFRKDGRLLYMSRGSIPSNKNNIFSLGFRQICVYAFPKAALEAFHLVNTKTRFEQEEDIEILRFLEMGYDVQMIELSDSSIAIDTPEDLEKVLKFIHDSK